MANKQFEKLMEPGKIGSVKTRNRIIKTGAGVMMWHEDETAMNSKVADIIKHRCRVTISLFTFSSSEFF